MNCIRGSRELCNEKNGLKVILFFVILGGIVWLLSTVFTPKWYTQPWHEAVTDMEQGFYAEQKDSIDVLFIGSSNVFRDVNPTVIYDETGITSYVLGSASQRIWVSKYYLEEALRYQNPQMVFLDLYTIFAFDLNGEGENRKALDYKNMSLLKLEAVYESIYEEGNTDEDYLSYIFPILRYHARWKELNADDFLYMTSDRHSYLKGYDITDLTEAQERFVYSETDCTEFEVNEKCQNYLNEIVEICNKNNAKLVFVKYPNLHWTQGMSAVCQKLADEYGVEFIDYNTIIDNIGLDYEQDFMDFVHLNYLGAEKLSRFVGRQMLELWKLPESDISKELKEVWLSDVERYNRMKTGYQFQNMDREKWGEILKKDTGYSVYIASHGEFVSGQDVFFDDLGLDNYAISDPNNTYLAVIKDGDIVTDVQKNGDDENTFYSYDNKIHSGIIVKCGNGQDGMKSVIKVAGKEYCQDKSGYNIVVYDELLKKVVGVTLYQENLEGE